MDRTEQMTEEIRVTAVLDAAVRQVGTGHQDSRQEAGGAWSEVAVDEDGHTYMITVQAVDIDPEGKVIV